VACYSLIDAGRKGVTTGSETKDFIPHSGLSRKPGRRERRKEGGWGETEK
jgi:hypothetical protein